MSAPPEKNIVVNRKASFLYTLSEPMEAGVVLLGTEVKSLRSAGNMNLVDAFVELRPDGAYLLQSYIAGYSHANRENHETQRPRKLLLHKSQLRKLRKGTRERGMTIIPLRVYFKGSLVKVEIALGKGKKLYDKRQSLKEKDIQKQLRRVRRS